MAVDVDFSDVDVEVVGNDLCEVEQQPLPVDSAQLGGYEIGHGLVLRPFDLLLDDVLAVLGCQTVQFVAGGLVDDDLSRGGILVPHDLVSGDGLAAFGDLELGFRRDICHRGNIPRGRIVGLLLLLLGNEEGPEFEDFAFGVDFEGLVEVFERHDTGSDLAVQLLLVVAVVDGDDFAQDAAAEFDVQRLHLLVEHLHAVFDVVLALPFEEALDRLLGFGRGDDFEPFGFGASVVGGDDLDLVSAVDLRGDGFELVVDLGADGAVSDLRVDVVREVERRSAVGHFPGLSFRCKYYDFRCVQR